MSGIRIVTNTLFAVAAIGTATVALAGEADATLRADLERIAQQRIFFGHQSVGRNLLEGINQLSEMAGVPVRVVEVATAGGVGPATIGHMAIGKNGDPLQKLQSFELAMGQQPAGIGIALMKFCYVDFTPNTDAKALFARYRATLEGLKIKNPGTVFVHVTAPLTIGQGGFKGGLKRLLGRAPYGAIENIHREEYNTLMRQAYLGREPIFDLARIESTAPDGAAVTIEWKGKVVPAMDSTYTDDGGHLNATGRLRAARELVSVLATIPNRPANNKSAR